MSRTQFVFIDCPYYKKREKYYYTEFHNYPFLYGCDDMSGSSCCEKCKSLALKLILEANPKYTLQSPQ